MLPPRALVATVLVSSILWVGLGAIGAGLAYSAAVPAPVTALLLPSTVPTALWFGPLPEVAIVAAIAGVVHAALLALVLRVVLRQGAPGIVPIWFSVVITGFVAAGVIAVGALLGEPYASGLRAFAGQTVSQLTTAGLWGVVWGWLPALVGARLATEPGPRRTPVLLPLAAAVLAVAAALLVLPTLGTQQAAPTAAPSPAPSITHTGWADIPSVAQPGVAAGTCDSDDITVAVDSGDAATGHRALGIRATNTGTSACTVEGYPDVAFDDAEGDAMDVLVVHGGSFMTTDPGIERVRLAPGASAVAQLGWNAQSAAGEQRASRLFVSVRPGAARLPVAVDLDVKDGGSVALTAWHAPASR